MSSPKWGVESVASALLCALLPAAALQGCNGRPEPREARPDVALIVIDTLRADRLGTYGHAAPTSPNIDRLAAGGLLYENATSTAPFTMPSMAAVMTGRYADRVGVHNHSPKDRLDAAATTLAEAAAAAGYRTGAVVSNPWLARRDSGFEQGFESYITRADMKRDHGRLDADTVVDRALDLLDANDDRPVFLWVHFIDTHMPYSPPLEIARDFGIPSGTSRVVDDFRNEETDRQGIYFEPQYDERELDATRNLYDAAIRWVDGEIGRLLGGWSDRRSRPRLTVILSDHGESLGDHDLYFAHDFTLFEELLHVPLIIHDGGDTAARVKTNVSTIDVMPTLCRRLRLHCPVDLDGATLPTADDATARRTVFAAGPPRRARYDRDPWLEMPGLEGRATMARSGRRKLIHLPRRGGGKWLAFDLDGDPGEVNSVYDAVRDAELQANLETWRAAMLEEAHPGAERPIAAPLDPQTRKQLRDLGYLD